MTTTTTQNPTAMDKARAEIDEITQWVEDHGGEVDHSAFIDACDHALSMAARAVGLGRVGGMIWGKGCVTLDLACSLCRTWLPTALMNTRLPGAKECRGVCDIEDY